MDISFLARLAGLAILALPAVYGTPSSVSLSISAPPSLSTITIAGQIFVVDPANLVLDSTTIQPGSAGVSIDGQVVSADAAHDLFVNGTEILAQPTSTAFAGDTPITSTASLGSSNVTFSRNVSANSAPTTAAGSNALGGAVASMAVQVASSLALQSAGDINPASVSVSKSLATGSFSGSNATFVPASQSTATGSSGGSVLLQTTTTNSSASSAMTSSSFLGASPAVAAPNVRTNVSQLQSENTASVSISGSTPGIKLIPTGSSVHINSSSGIYAVVGASQRSQNPSSNSQSMSSAGATSQSATLVPGAQPNSITTGPTLASPTISLNPTGSVASSQGMLLVGAIFGITEEAKTLSAIIKDDGPKQSFISKLKGTEDEALEFLEDLHPPDPPPSYEEACLDGASIFDLVKLLGCLKGGFDDVIDDLQDEPPDLTKIETLFDNIGKLAENVEKEEDDDDDDDKTTTSETDSQTSQTQSSATKGSSASMSTTLSMTTTTSSRTSSSTSTGTASMDYALDPSPIADPDNYTSPDIADQAFMAFLGDVLSSAVGIGPGPSGFSVAVGSANATANISSPATMSSPPTTPSSASLPIAVASAGVAAGSSNSGSVTSQVSSPEAASSQATFASTEVPTSTAAANGSAIGSAIGAILQEGVSASAASASAANAAATASAAAANGAAIASGIAGLINQGVSASAVSASAAIAAASPPTTSSPAAPSPDTSAVSTGPKWGIYLGFQVYTWGGANAWTDYYYKVWLEDLIKSPGGPDFCAPKSWITNVQVNDNVDNVPPYPTKDFDFVIPKDTVDTMAMQCIWHPSPGNSQPGSLSCGPGNPVLCTIPPTTAITCKGDNPNRIEPLAQCVF